MDGLRLRDNKSKRWVVLILPIAYKKFSQDAHHTNRPIINIRGCKRTPRSCIGNFVGGK